MDINRVLPRARLLTRLAVLVAWMGLAVETLPSAAAAEPKPPFKIGMIVSLSGKTAEYGQSIQNCVQLARAARPDLFTNLEFIFEDAIYDTKLAVSAFQKLRTVNRANLVMVWGISFCQAIAPLAEAAQFPVVSLCIDRDSGRGRKYVFRFMNYFDEYTQAVADYLNAQGWKNLGVVLTDNPYLQGMFEGLQRSLHPGQKVEQIDLYQSDQTDMRATITKLRRSRYDAVGVFLAAGQIAAFYRQARELNLKLPTFGTNFFESQSEIDASQGAMDGAVFSFNAIQPDFVKLYDAKYQSNSQLAFGALAHEFALLAGELFNGRPDLTPLEIMEALQRIKGRPGVAAGPYSFVEKPEVGKYFQFPIAIKKIQNGRIVLLDQ